MKKTLLLILFLLGMLMPNFVMANEFGLVINQNADIGGSDDVNFEYNALIVPRLQFMFGDTGSLFVSAGLNLGYSDAEGFTFVPELLRTELSLQLGVGSALSIGRFGYSTPFPFLVEGLFDGVQFSNSSSAGRFRIGGWFTGFLYKNSAMISMTGYDRSVNDYPLVYSNFTGTYFAPSRVIASIDWEHFSIADVMRLNITATAQFDLTNANAEEKYDSQYLTIKMGLPAGSFLFELGGILSTFQNDSDALEIAYAGEFGIYCTLPTIYNSRLSLTAQYSNESFIPITTKYVGDIFKAKLSALTVLDLNYMARFTDKFSTSINAKYFIRNNMESFNTFPIAGEGDEGTLMGAEFFARFIWSPFSDLQFNFGGGAFVPSLGDNWPQAKPVWLVKVAVVFVAY